MTIEAPDRDHTSADVWRLQCAAEYDAKMQALAVAADYKLLALRLGEELRAARIELAASDLLLREMLAQQERAEDLLDAQLEADPTCLSLMHAPAGRWRSQ